jgi:hypothetical protein
MTDLGTGFDTRAYRDNLFENMETLWLEEP